MTTDPQTDPRVKDLRDAQRRLRSVLIANADRLDKPFTDDPDKNPWDTYVRPAMRELKSAVDAIAAPAAAVPVAAPPTTEQTAEARCAVCRRSGDDSHPAVCFPPAPADRAATLREAATRLDGLTQEAAGADMTMPEGRWQAGLDTGIRELRRLAVEAEQAGGPSREATEPQLRCVCGDPVQLMDEDDPTSWIHSPGSDTRCLDARPRCPHCQMPHDLTPSVALACASIRASIAAAAAPAVSSRPGTEQEA